LERETKTSQKYLLMKVDIPGAWFWEDALVCPGVMDVHRGQNVKIMQKKGLFRRHADITQSTSILQVRRSLFVNRGLVGSRGFTVRNNPHGLILTAKGWTDNGAVFSK